MSDTAPRNGMTEQALRTRLTELAGHAPQALADLDRGVARAAALGTGTGPGTGPVSQPVPIRGNPHQGLARPLGECTTDLSKFIVNSGRAGLSKTMVPGTPTEVSYCGYYGPEAKSTGQAVSAGQGGLGGTKADQARNAAAISGLVAQLNASAGATAACPAFSGDPMTQWRTEQSVTTWLFKFAYSSGPDTNVLVTVGTSCDLVTNGVLRGTLTEPVGIVLPSYFGVVSPPSGRSSPKVVYGPPTNTP